MKTYALFFIASLISFPFLTKAQTKSSPPFQATNIQFFENDDQQPVRILTNDGLSQFRVQFSIEGNSEAKQGDQILYLVLRNVITKDVFQNRATGSGFLEEGGRKRSYTATTTFNYREPSVIISIPVIIDENQIMEAGAWDAYIFWNKRVLGKKRVAVQAQDPVLNDPPADSQEDPADNWEGYRATNFKFYKNNESSPSKLIVRRGIDQIKIQFDFEGRNITPGNKDIFLVFQNVVTKKVYDCVSSRSEAFIADGEELTSTARIILKDYQGGVSTLARPVYQDSEGQFGPGTWEAIIYCEGKMIGRKRVVIQQ